MRITIVGGGSIGRIFGYFLGSASNQITLLDTDQEIVDSACRDGICFIPQASEDLDDFHSIKVQATTNSKEIDKADLILLTVKSSSLKAAVAAAEHLIGDDCPLLSFQTGLGSVEEIQTTIHPRHILVGVTLMSGTALTGAKVRLGSMGNTHVGELTGKLTPRLEKIAQLLNNAMIPTRLSSSVACRLWEKVLVFSAINPISSILRVPNGCLTTEPAAVKLIKQLLYEGWDVAKACGVHLEKDQLYPAVLEECIQSANNLSPMLQDILNNKPTEVDCQNGAIIEYAQEHDLDVPTHGIMLQLIKLLESYSPGVEQMWFP